MSYRCEAATIEGFVQQLAVSYVAHGYWFFVTGIIPEGKDPRRVDEKLIEKYEVDLSKFARARRKAAGKANIQYLRHRRFFVLLATHGEHKFFLPIDAGGEGGSIRDCRKAPIIFASYAISSRAGHAHVGIERETLRDLKAFCLEHACHWSPERIAQTLRTLPFEPYAPVRSQLWTLLRLINRVRKTAQLEPVPASSLRVRRKIFRPFEGPERFSRSIKGVEHAGIRRRA
jgi:hypothetical protein